MMISRRGALTGLAVASSAAMWDRATIAGGGTPPMPVPPGGRSPEELAHDEHFWRGVAAQYTVSSDFLNLEAGYYGIMSDPVRRAYHDAIDELNARNSYLLRTSYKKQSKVIIDRIATMLGVSEDEIVLTQSGTEALQNLISGYNKLAPGDSVMYADLDYPDMTDTMDWLQDRRGVSVVRIDIPEPPTREAVLETYASALHADPTVKLLLLSHVNNKTGLALPVADIIEMARERGVDVILDSAHAWGQLDFTLSDIGADFAGFSLHKWIGAPLGTGFLYIRKERFDAIDPVFGDQSYPATDINSRVVSGTRDVASALTIPTALDFHDDLGAPAKNARLRSLRDTWVQAVADVDNIEILTPDDPGMYGALTSFRITGRTSEADNKAITQYLFDEHRIFTVARTGVANGACVRVTPALYNLREDVERFGEVLREVADRFRL